MSITPSAKAYLDKHLLTRFANIGTKKTDSDILITIGLGDVPSYQSFLIQCGYAYEDFWNQVLSNCKGVTNELLNGNKINVPGVYTGKRKAQATQQIDHLFKIGNMYFYRESKCNLNFDSEKSPTSVKKIISVAKLIAADKKVSEDKVNYGYFVPVVRQVPLKTKKKATKITNQDGVSDLIDLIGKDNLPFTVDEYFFYQRTTLNKAIKLKLNIA